MIRAAGVFGAPLGVLLSLLVLHGAARAQCLTTALVNGDSLPFGSAIDVEGDRMVVGDWGLFGSGAALVFQRAPFGWAVVQQLGPWGGVPGAVHFGASVALSGDLVLAGAPTEGGAAGASCGAAYLFVRDDSVAGSPYALTQRLVAGLPSAQASFGAALALSGSTAAIGEPGADLVANNSGAVQVSQRVGDQLVWQATLTPDSLTPGASFGASLALAGDTLVVGAPGESAVYIYQQAGGLWSLEARLAPPEASSYGATVALHGESLLVGAPDSSLSAIKSGGVWVHRRAAILPPPVPGSPSAAWPVEAVLQASDTFFFWKLGTSVALSGEVAAVGASGAGGGQGAVYLFQRSGVNWTQSGKLAALPGPAHQGLGVSTALDGDVLAFGASATFGQPGVTFVAGGLQPWQTIESGLAGTFGEPQLAAQGALCGGTNVTLTVSPLPAGAPVLFFLGTSAVNLPCKGGVFVPWPELVLSSAAGVTGSVTVQGAWPAGQPGMQDLFVQAWAADFGAPHGLVATDALRITTP